MIPKIAKKAPTDTVTTKTEIRQIKENAKTNMALFNLHIFNKLI